MSTPLLQVSGLNAYYGASHVLHDLDFKVQAGQTVGLMGRNGMGKSTLLKSITGLLKPRSGRIEFQNTAIHGKTPYDIAWLGMAYVPEGRGIFGTLSVHENLVMSARAGVRGQQDWTYQRVLDTFPRLGERLQHGGQQLSGGEQQMLTVARTLMGNPDAVLLDEPSEGLAPVILELMAEAVLSMKREGIAVLLSEQNFDFAAAVADRAYIIERGEIRYDGSMAALEADPALRAQHLTL